MSAEVETASIGDDVGRRLEAFVKQHAHDGPRDATPPHPDAFTYEIAHLDEGHSTSVAESDIPVELRPLIRELVSKGSVG